MTSIAVFCHMFHADLFPEVARHLTNIPFPADLYFSTSAEKHRAALSKLFPDAAIEIVPNRGRDIAPKLITFGRAQEGYDYVLHLHTKASVPAWRQHLFNHLIGSAETICAIIDAFERDARIGIIAPPHYSPIAPWVSWDRTRAYAEPLATRMGIALPDTIEFPAGSMFWARPKAIKPMIDLGLRYADFPSEPIPRHSLAHAIERMVFISAIRAGYGWGMISLDNGAPYVEGPYFSPARPGWAPPPKPSKGHPLVRLAKRLRRSARRMRASRCSLIPSARGTSA